MTAVLEKKIYTYDDIKSLPEGNYEIIEGKMVEITPTGFRHGRFEVLFAELLMRHLKGRGYVATGEVGVIINKSPLTVRAADVVYISKEKMPFEPKGMLEMPPDLIIEIVSESNVQWELTDKIKDYLLFGVERVILIDPQTETVNIYQKGKREVLFYSFDEEFEIIEGLTVRVKEIVL